MAEYGVPAATAIGVLRDMGESVRGPSSSLQPPVARKLRVALEARGYEQRIAYFRGLTGSKSARATALLDAVPRAVPELIALLATHVSIGSLTPGENLLRTAFKDADLFYMPPRAQGDLEQRERETQTLSSDDLPSPVGIALLPGGDAPGEQPWGILTWYERPTLLSLSWLPVANRTTGGRRSFERGREVHDDVPYTAGVFIHPDGQPGILVSRLAALLACVPEQRSTRVADSVLAPKDRPGGPDVQAVPAESDVTFVYPTRGAGNLAWTTGIRRTSRWKVRGHWRQQWYRSEQAHRRIWIDEHEAGAQDAPMKEAQRVIVIAPRLTPTGS